MKKLTTLSLLLLFFIACNTESDKEVNKEAKNLL